MFNFTSDIVKLLLVIIGTSLRQGNGNDREAIPEVSHLVKPI